MAFLPCDACGQKFLGKSSTVYPALLNGSQRDSSRLRLCADCFASYRAVLLEKAENRLGGVADDPDGTAHCHWCGKNGRSDGEPLLFVTLYPARGEREDFWARLHENCVPDVAANMLLRST